MGVCVCVVYIYLDININKVIRGKLIFKESLVKFSAKSEYIFCVQSFYPAKSDPFGVQEFFRNSQISFCMTLLIGKFSTLNLWFTMRVLIYSSPGPFLLLKNKSK